MKKFVFFVFLFIILLPSVVFGEVIKIDDFNSIPVASDRTVIYFKKIGLGSDSIKVKTNSALNFYQFYNKADGDNVKKDEIVIYYKGDMKSNVDASNVATITLKDAAYYIDSNNNTVSLDIIVNFQQVKLNAFTDVGNGECKSDNKFAIAQISENNLQLYIWQLYNSKNLLLLQNIGSLSKCQANAEYTISIEFSGNLPQNIQFPWKIRDLDQPDTRGVGLEGVGGEYAESIQFNSGFSNAFYVKNNTYLEKSANFNKFYNNKKEYGRQEYENAKNRPVGTGDDTKGEVSMDYSTVSTFQYQHKATVVWRGSRSVGTGLLGIFLKPNNNYIVHDCQTKNKLNGSCGVENKIVDKVNVKNDKSSISTSNLVGTVLKRSTHSSCKEKIVNLKNVCVKINNKKVNATVSANVILTENINFMVNKPYYSHDGKSFAYVYAGGGFSWKGAYLENNIGWVYKYYLNNENHPMIMVGSNYYSINAGILYDSSCVNAISRSSLDAIIDMEVKNLIAKNNTINFNFKSNDVNDASKGVVSMNDSHAIQVSKSVNGLKAENKVILNDAYLHLKTGEIDYNNHSKDSNYKLEGPLYFVPLKYTKDTTYIALDNTDISVIGQNLKTSVKCNIGVEQILYSEGDNKKLKVTYRYRPIDVSNPFPKANTKSKVAEKAENWAEWYYGENSSIHQSRLNNTFGNNVFYEVTINNNTGPKITSFNDQNSFYADFGSVSSDGTSNFVNRDKGIFDVLPNVTSYCPLGIFENSCDQYR